MQIAQAGQGDGAGILWHLPHPWAYLVRRPHLQMWPYPKTSLLLTSFTPLTGLRLGIPTLSHLTSEPARSKDLLLATPHLGSRKLLSFIPSRYGHVPLLRHATDCIIAKLRQLVHVSSPTSTHGEATILLHYTKALRALQRTLDDESERTTPETLLAVELLGILEVCPVPLPRPTASYQAVCETLISS